MKLIWEMSKKLLLLLPILISMYGCQEPGRGTDTKSLSSPVGQTKLIRVGDTTAGDDLPVFTTKDALIRFMRAAGKNDSAGMLATLPDTFRVMDYTPVRIVDYDPIGKGLFNIEVLEGTKKGRTGWVMDIDLRER